MVLKVGATQKNVFGKDAKEEFHAQEVNMVTIVVPIMRTTTMTTIAIPAASGFDQINQINHSFQINHHSSILKMFLLPSNFIAF